MDTTFTNEKDERFLNLVRELDRGYYKRIGDELSKYDSYNEFKNPHVVILAFDNNIAVACASYRIFDNDSVKVQIFAFDEFREESKLADNDDHEFFIHIDACFFFTFI